MSKFLEENLEIKAMKWGLDRMKTLDRVLGFPSRSFPVVHIAGTNGKGSVATKIATICQSNGKKVGLFTSPHLISFTERIQINQQPVAEAEADRLFKKIMQVTNLQPSYFELLTLLAFCYFAESKIDLAVLEVGMGGRLDATNIVTPLISVIASVDLDHTHYLGTTLEAIAFEKGGIIKTNIPVVLGKEAKPLSVFEKIASDKNSPLFQVKGAFVHYEEENRAIANKVISLLPYRFDECAIQQGLEAVPPCRFEIVQRQNPLIIKDVAHNPAALKRTFERIAATFNAKPIRVLAAFSKGKDIDGLLEVLLEKAREVHLTQADHPRAFLIEKYSAPSCHIDVNLRRAFETVYREAAQHDELMLICGTFFMMETIAEGIRILLPNK